MLIIYAREFCLFPHGEVAEGFWLEDGRKMVEIFWIVVCWIIWLGENNYVFNEKNLCVDEIVISIKLLRGNWIAVGGLSSKNCSLYDWFLTPSLYL